jgi:nonribosomal peptide synthetase DhbF
MYRTGDIVRYRHCGNIEFIGRNDLQVKVRGHRIELNEITAVITQYRGIKYATTIVREDRPGDKRIASYLVKDDNGGPLDTGKLRDHVTRMIPAYMVPQFFIEVQNFPLLPNGKIDTRALPARMSWNPTTQ